MWWWVAERERPTSHNAFFLLSRFTPRSFLKLSWPVGIAQFSNNHHSDFCRSRVSLTPAPTASRWKPRNVWGPNTAATTLIREARKRNQTESPPLSPTSLDSLRVYIVVSHGLSRLHVWSRDNSSKTSSDIFFFLIHWTFWLLLYKLLAKSNLRHPA